MPKVFKLVKVRLGPDCRRVPAAVRSLGTYFNVLDSLLRKEGTYWFRGNALLTWRLTPSALRLRSELKRNKAFNLLADFKRFGEIKLRKPPAPNEEFKWVQLAQHYGLPTRLLDWTKNAAIALYFACNDKYEKDNGEDGAVYILNALDLNREALNEARVFDPQQDTALIEKYLKQFWRNIILPKNWAHN